MPVLVSNAVTDFRRRAIVRGLAFSQTDADDPLHEWAKHPAIWDVFADESDLLATLQEHWSDLLIRRIYGEPRYPLGPERTGEVYAELSDEFPALRAVLERYQEFPAIAHAINEERILLARSAGHLDHVSSATQAWRGRDILDKVPAQRGA